MARYTLRVNGQERQVEAEPGDSLLSVLRDDLRLTGTRYGCGEGHCGACTVLLDGQAARSCVTRLGAIPGKPITTIEGIAALAETGARRDPANDTRETRLHAVQEAFLEAEAFQCGYCTSGMIVAVVALLRANPDPSEQDIAKTLDRNVCRCGTYPRIVQAIRTAATRMRTTSAGGTGWR